MYLYVSNSFCLLEMHLDWSWFQSTQREAVLKNLLFTEMYVIIFFFLNTTMYGRIQDRAREEGRKLLGAKITLYIPVHYSISTK